jgi:site-specific recombinase XerD
VQSYLEAVDLFTRYLVDQGMPTTLAGIRREHVEASIESLLVRFKTATAANRHAGLRAFFNWAVDEGEVRESPMVKMHLPRQPELLTPVLSRAQIEAIHGACKGSGFGERRDAGIIRVMGKGPRERVTHAGARAVKALDRYERVRGQDSQANSPSYWLGRHGPMRPSGISQVIKDRGARAGIPGLHADKFRHWYAHAMLAVGHQEGDIMALAGWRSREMLARYARATRVERTLEVSRRLGPADDL